MTKPDAYLLTYREISHAGSVSCVTRASLDNDPVWADPDCRSLELISEVPLFKVPPEATQTRWIKCSERIPKEVNAPENPYVTVVNVKHKDEIISRGTVLCDLHDGNLIPIGPGFLPKGWEIVAWLENLPEFVP